MLTASLRKSEFRTPGLQNEWTCTHAKTKSAYNRRVASRQLCVHAHKARPTRETSHDFRDDSVQVRVFWVLQLQFRIADLVQRFVLPSAVHDLKL